jgi:hypothetical protein
VIPSWSLPLGYLLLMISIGCVLAVIVNGCQVPMRDAMNRETAAPSASPC